MGAPHYRNVLAQMSEVLPDAQAGRDAIFGLGGQMGKGYLPMSPSASYEAKLFQGGDGGSLRLGGRHLNDVLASSRLYRMPENLRGNGATYLPLGLIGASALLTYGHL